MKCKIVAIGGGENGRKRADGTYAKYETKQIDQRIVELTQKECPNFCFMAHSQLNEELEISYFETMKRIYNGIFGCECKMIKRIDLEEDIERAKGIIDWADIIYEGGGDTKSMIELWKKTAFDKILKEAYLNGKVICGVSAGANAWFKSCSSDSLRIQTGNDNAPLINVECLGFVNALLTPHCDVESERLSHMKKSLKDIDLVGIGLSNCAAIEIVDDKFKIITSSKDAYALKTYWKDGKYISENINSNNNYEDLGKLLVKTSR